MSTKIIFGAIFSIKDEKITLLAKGVNLSSYPFFKRSSIEGFCTFLGKEVACRVNKNGVLECFRDSEYYLDLTLAKEGYSDYLRKELHDYQIQTYSPILLSDDKLRVVFITSMNYPSAPILRLSISLLKEFNSCNLVNANANANANANIANKILQEKIDQCQNPKAVDKIAFIQGELEETKLIMISNIDSILKRGEKLEEVLAKTTDISESSKLFLKKSKKLNSWCC